MENMGLYLCMSKEDLSWLEVFFYLALEEKLENYKITKYHNRAVVITLLVLKLV